MNTRERFQNVMHFKKVDRVPCWEMHYWEDTVKRWYKEGIFTPSGHLEDYFNFDVRKAIGVNTLPFPSSEEITIEETEKYRVWIGSDGIKRKSFKGRESSAMPQFIEFPVKDRRTWENFKKRLDPTTPGRYVRWWEEKKESWRNRDYVLYLRLGSLFGHPRNWIGLEKFTTLFYDDPMLVHDIMEYLTEFYIQVSHKAVDEVNIDYARFSGEDMAYKGRAMISPKMVKEFILPRYRRIVSFLRDHGIDICFIDSDGNVDELIPLWLEAGINGVLPLEIAAGMDPVALRKKYGKRLLMMGGIDKRMLSKDKETIRKEVLSKVPYLYKKRGYIAHVDHWVPPDISLENFSYYIDLMKKVSRFKEV